MNPDNELGKLSLNSSWKVEQLGRAYGAITPQDVAAALGMGNLSRQAEIIGRAKYLDDLPERDREDLINLVMMDLTKKILKEGWKTNKPGILYKLVCFALFEIIAPPGCKDCAGRGHHQHENKVTDCNACLGTGRGVYSGWRIAKDCEIPDPDWSKTWSARYKYIYSLMRRYDNEIRKHVIRYMES